MPDENTSASEESALLVDALVRVMRELRRNYDASAAELGLTFSRARVLSCLVRCEGATQAELAQSLGVEPPTLKRQIDALEKDGFVERRGLDGDARKRALFLTDKARSSRLTSYVATLRREISRGITQEESRMVRAALERIADNAMGLNRP
ncbi:MarR family winged helix-turn-helix transcriptional regulator [Paenirhodobacter sp.]|uniref:MarR family winged helix-turn-helix transcriptional regulator n=1 Tax=Paenirhodobacter sp. TaxID=1965326 RepID=UPI003B3BF4F8